MKKRVIKKEDYPMVLNWEGYKNTRTKLPCKCQECGCCVIKHINRIDNAGGKSFCFTCGNKIKRTPHTSETKEKIRNSHINRSRREKYISNLKREKTLKEKYNITNISQSNIIKFKKISTCLENNGVEYPSQSEIIKRKTKETCLERYGVEYPTQKNRTPEQIEITSSKENLYQYIDSSSSNMEKELSEYINSLGFTTEKKRFNWGEIDIFVPEKNIGFEFNGCYWHNDKKVHKNYHYDKVTNAQNEGIRLIHIWEHEWLNKQEYMKSYIKAQLGLCTKRIFARKCEVREIDFKTSKPLLEYHQQNATRAQVYLGLYHEDELVLCMLLSRTTKGIFTQNPIAEWDLKREICKEGYSVVGGKSKVFKYFLRKYNPPSVVSYVDRSKFTGNSYRIMGFELDHINRARYDWIFKEGLVFKKRQPCIYKEMKKLYNEDKVLRIYDSGRYCFIWKPKN